MAFTDEDRNVLVATKTKVDNIEGWIASLPCQQQPPVCLKTDKLDDIEKRLSNTRNWVAGVVATVIGGGALALLAALLTHLARGG
jgi:hypothetical protein